MSTGLALTYPARTGCNPLMGLLCFQPDGANVGSGAGQVCCNPLMGLLCFQLDISRLVKIGISAMRCNPLMGLLCFQLRPRPRPHLHLPPQLQSPDGASLFSTLLRTPALHAQKAQLQSPDGASLFSTRDTRKGTAHVTIDVAIP